MSPLSHRWFQRVHRTTVATTKSGSRGGVLASLVAEAHRKTLLISMAANKSTSHRTYALASRGSAGSSRRACSCIRPPGAAGIPISTQYCRIFKIYSNSQLMPVATWEYETWNLVMIDVKV